MDYHDIKDLEKMNIPGLSVEMRKTELMLSEVESKISLLEGKLKTKHDLSKWKVQTDYDTNVLLREFLSKYIKTIDKILTDKKMTNDLDIIKGETDNWFFCRRSDVHEEFYVPRDFFLEIDSMLNDSDLLFRYDIEKSQSATPTYIINNSYYDDTDMLDNRSYPIDQSTYTVKLYFVRQREGFMFSVYVYGVDYVYLKRFEEFIIERYKKLSEVWRDFNLGADISK